MEPIIGPEELKQAQAFHGNVCLGLPLGLRVGGEALRALGVARSADKELTAIAEVAPEQFSHCFLDGVQWITGCTIGKGNLQLAPLGKFALTLVQMESRRAVRVAFRAEFLEEFLRWPPVAAKAEGRRDYRPEPGEVPQRIEDILQRPTHEIVSIRQLGGYSVALPKMDWTHRVCADCGELVIGGYTHELGGDALCPACLARRAHAGTTESGVVRP
jgi:formylmethanofuran dehydrogenase subunit E